MTLNIMLCSGIMEYNYNNTATKSELPNEETRKTEVLVTLTSEESKNWVDYSCDHFIVSDCIAIEDLTSSYNPKLSKDTAQNNCFKRILKLSFSEKNEEELNNILTIIKQVPGVDSVNTNDLIEIRINEELNINKSQSRTINNNWGNESINLNNAKQLISSESITPKSVNVGVLEYGIDGSHSDLQNRVNTLISKSFVDNSPCVDGSADGHGTAVAGIIAANVNSAGIDGVCDNASIVSLKFSVQGYISNGETYFGQTEISDIIEILNYAHANSIRILNCSFGYDVYNESIETAMKNFGELIVCGAGNSVRNTDSTASYPASYELDNIISVGGIHSDNSMWYDSPGIGSNYGQNSVDLFAPSCNIYSTKPNNQYDYYSGTSFAAPFVSGVAAMLLSIENETYSGNLSVNDIKGIILSSAQAIAGLTDYCVSGGILDAEEAVRTALAYVPIYSYEQYDSTYHIVRNQYGTGHLEEHFWVPNLRSGESIYAISPITSYVCNKCGSTKISF